MERIQRRTAPKKDLNELDTTIMCSVIQSQTFWSVKWAVGSTAGAKLVDAMEFQ